MLDPPFQRRNVWSTTYRQDFIDTVLRNYPSPAIFLEWEVGADGTKLNVVDGQQRLHAILDFTRDEFALRPDFVQDGEADLLWSQLNPENRDKFRDYEITVENIYDASDEERRSAFDRLNRNVARLTSQELRHARFPGTFLERMEALAADPFWISTGIVSPANVRRMRDVEFVSELFLLTAVGVVDGSPEDIDAYYATWDQEIPDEERARARFDEIQTYVGALPLSWADTRWNNMNDFYGLWGALLELGAERPEAADAAAKLTGFSERQYEIIRAARAGEDLPGDESERQYYESVRQGANKTASRTTRIGVLAALLRG